MAKNARYRDNYENTSPGTKGIVNAPGQSLVGWHPGPSFNIQRPRLVLDLKSNGGRVGITWKYKTEHNGKITPLEVHDVTQDFMAIIQGMDAVGKRSLGFV